MIVAINNTPCHDIETLELFCEPPCWFMSMDAFEADSRFMPPISGVIAVGVGIWSGLQDRGLLTGDNGIAVSGLVVPCIAVPDAGLFLGGKLTLGYAIGCADSVAAWRSGLGEATRVRDELVEDWVTWDDETYSSRRAELSLSVEMLRDDAWWWGIGDVESDVISSAYDTGIMPSTREMAMLSAERAARVYGALRHYV